MKDLRRMVRMFKAMNGATYKDMANVIGISQSSFYNWLRGDYELSEERAAFLRTLIEKIGIIYG